MDWATFVEWLRELQRADQLRIESGGHLHAHAAAEEPDVHDAQIRFLPPSHLVLLHHAGDDGVGSTILSFDETHDAGVEALKAA